MGLNRVVFYLSDDEFEALNICSEQAMKVKNPNTYAKRLALSELYKLAESGKFLLTGEKTDGKKHVLS